jgi:dienelactone hydrolase
MVNLGPSISESHSPESPDVRVDHCGGLSWAGTMPYRIGTWADGRWGLSGNTSGFAKPTFARIAGVVLASLALALMCRPSAAELVQPRGMVREIVSVPFRQSDGQNLTLEAILVRPGTGARFPLVVISHGSPRRLAEAKKRDLHWADWIANDFARRGWAAATVLRRGYGNSEGAVADSYGTCSDPQFSRAGLTSAQDILQAVSYFQKQPYVDSSRVLLVGVSAGGFGSIAAASLAPAGLVAVVNFAGGRGSIADGQVCKPDQLVDAYARFGTGVRIPSLWIYSQNDHFFGPDLARRMFTAFTTAGAPAELVIAPPYERDGHRLIFGQPLWRDVVYSFLRRNDLPFGAPVLPTPSGASGEIAQAFADYLATPDYEKAFVVGKAGYYGWASGYDSVNDALAAARRYCAQHCDTVYAIDDTLGGEAPRSAGSPVPPAATAVTTPVDAGADVVKRLLKGSP